MLPLMQYNNIYNSLTQINLFNLHLAHLLIMVTLCFGYRLDLYVYVYIHN
jgi:hypothetical protein